MKWILKPEDLAQFAIAFIMFTMTGSEWWLFFALLPVPDFGIVNYAMSTKTVAVSYNLTHHKGIVMFSHSSSDSTFGYGLKYPDNFFNTQLGRMGQN